MDGSGDFKTDVRIALQRILLKFLQLIQSRKFWAAVVAILSILVAWHNGAITADVAIWSIVTTVVTYSGFTTIEDVARAR